MFKRIRLRLTAWYVAVLLTIVLLSGLITYLAFSRSLSNEVDDSLRSSAQALASQINEEALDSIQLRGGADGDKGRDEGYELSFFSATGGDTFYLVLAPDGSSLVNPSNVSLPGVPDAEAARVATADGDEWSTVSSDGAEFRLYSLAIRHEGRPIAVVQMGRSLAEQDRQMIGLLIVLSIAGIGGLVLAAGGGLLVAGRALRPVREAFDRQRTFVADASHELRTPLTIIRGNAEMLELSETAQFAEEDHRSLRDIVGQAGYMEHLVADLSFLARLDEGQLPLRKEPVNVRELREYAARAAITLGADKNLEVEAHAPPDMAVQADRVRLEELLLALVENAVRHTPAGGRIKITARDGRAPSISVEDTGPGVDPEHMGLIFGRFYRADEARTREGGGIGLGLSIARAIALAHGGGITVENALGGGAIFTVQLPFTDLGGA